MTEAASLIGYLEPLLPRYVEELRELSAIECPTASKPGVDEAGAWVRRWVEARGWDVMDWPDDEVGNSLVATARGNGTRPRIMLVAHLDTVYPVGIAAERPMVQEGDVIRGPGTADNKSGLLSGLYAMAALQDLGLLGSVGSVSMVCGGDEESGGMRSSGALLRELAPRHDAGLVLEAGRENGDIVSARKGSGHFRFQVHGKQAHAGVEPYKGANAILALAQQVVALQLLNGVRPGTTVNVGVISGGTKSNVVPDRAEAVVDVRVARAEDMEPVGEAIQRIAGTPYVLGTSTVLEGGWGASPMDRTPQIEALATLARECARELGFTVDDAATGGISYANHLAASGLPVLDGLGPVGGLDHSPDEYILASSIVPRTALLALLIKRIGDTGFSATAG